MCVQCNSATKILYLNMSSFSQSDFCSSYLPSYFAERFEPMCKENHSGCIDDIDANWNIFVFVDNFIQFISTLNLDAKCIKTTFEDHFLINMEDLSTQKIQASLTNNAISNIIVSGLNQSSVPVVQLMLRLYVVEVCGMTESYRKMMDKLIEEGKDRTECLQWQYFPKLLKYVLLMCLKRCKSLKMLKVYQTLLEQNNYEFILQEQIHGHYLKLTQVKSKGIKKETSTRQKDEPQQNTKVAQHHGLSTPPKKKPQPRSPRQNKQSFNPHQFLKNSSIPSNMRSAQKFVKQSSLSRDNLPRTLNEITKKKFIPKKNHAYSNYDSSITTPTSYRNKAVFQVSKKRSHSMMYLQELGSSVHSFNPDCLVDDTPVSKALMTVPQNRKSDSQKLINFDILSPKKKLRKLY